MLHRYPAGRAASRRGYDSPMRSRLLLASLPVLAGCSLFQSTPVATSASPSASHLSFERLFGGSASASGWLQGDLVPGLLGAVVLEADAVAPHLDRSQVEDWTLRLLLARLQEAGSTVLVEPLPRPPGPPEPPAPAHAPASAGGTPAAILQPIADDPWSAGPAPSPSPPAEPAASPWFSVGAPTGAPPSAPAPPAAHHPATRSAPTAALRSLEFRSARDDLAVVVQAGPAQTWFVAGRDSAEQDSACGADFSLPVDFVVLRGVLQSWPGGELTGLLDEVAVVSAPANPAVSVDLPAPGSPGFCPAIAAAWQGADSLRSTEAMVGAAATNVLEAALGPVLPPR